MIATPWPSSDRSAIETAYRQQFPDAGPIAWIALTPGDDPTRLVPRLGVDLVLGLGEADLDRLANSGQLTGFDPESNRQKSMTRPWEIARRSTLGLAVNPGLGVRVPGPGLDDRSLAGMVAIDDPRRDPVCLAWAKFRIENKGYGEVVRSVANATRVGRSGSALATVLRGEVAVAAAVGIEGAIDGQSSLVKLEGAGGWVEGVAIVRGARLETEAQAFVGFLRDRGQAIVIDGPARDRLSLDADSLLADLLGSSLVDAQDELRDAVVALDRAGHPADLEAYLDSPPPWPPTSVAKLRARDDPHSLLKTLAREISDDPDARFWLLEAWDGPARKVDAAWLREAAGVAEGRLVREPRFRAWLRGEWTAWGRQHYRRIAREAGKVAR